MATDIPKEQLDSWWIYTEEQLARNPGDWDALAMRTLMENEYARRGWVPTTSGKKPPESERLSPYLIL